MKAETSVEVPPLFSLFRRTQSQQKFIVDMLPQAFKENPSYVFP